MYGTRWSWWPRPARGFGTRRWGSRWACGRRPQLCSAPLGVPGCSSLPYLHPCKLAFSSGLVLVSFSPLLIAHCRYLPALTSRFWCPDLETPPPSWTVSTVALTKAKVDLRLPACHVPPCFPDSCLPLIFPSQPLHRVPLPSPLPV